MPCVFRNFYFSTRIINLTICRWSSLLENRYLTTKRRNYGQLFRFKAKYLNKKNLVIYHFLLKLSSPHSGRFTNILRVTPKCSERGVSMYFINSPLKFILDARTQYVYLNALVKGAAKQSVYDSLQSLTANYLLKYTIDFLNFPFN